MEVNIRSFVKRFFLNLGYSFNTRWARKIDNTLFPPTSPSHRRHVQNHPHVVFRGKVRTEGLFFHWTIDVKPQCARRETATHARVLVLPRCASPAPWCLATFQRLLFVLSQGLHSLGPTHRTPGLGAPFSSPLRREITSWESRAGRCSNDEIALFHHAIRW